MNDAAPPLPASPVAGPPGYPPDSRYAGVATVTRRLPDGRTVTYLRRRFVPPAERLATMHEHVVRATDRLDTLAATYYGDSQLWWRIADAAGVTDPDAALVPGRRIRIPHPEGLPGVPL